MYFSRVLNTKIRDSSDALVGRLADIAIIPEAGQYPALGYIFIRPTRKAAETVVIAFDQVANLSSDEITLKGLWKNIVETPAPKESVRLSRDIMDEQIVDVEGARVMRVNDLKIGSLDGLLRVLGIDVSFRGILRRLGLSGLDVFNIFNVNLIDWRKAHLVRGALKLDTISKDLIKLHPADLANIVEELSVKNASSLVGSLPGERAAHVVEEMDPAIQKTIIQYLGPERAAEIFNNMSVDEAVDLLQTLPKGDAAKFLSFLQNTKSKKIERLIKYPDDTAGGLMTLDYMSARPDWTVAQTVEEIRKISPTLRTMLYVYVTDADWVLRGVVSVRTLLVAEQNQILRQLFKPIAKRSTLRPRNKIKEVIRIMTKYDLFSAAVVDKERRLVGVVTIDDVMRQVAPNA